MTPIFGGRLRNSGRVGAVRAWGPSLTEPRPLSREGEGVLLHASLPTNNAHSGAGAASAQRLVVEEGGGGAIAVDQEAFVRQPQTCLFTEQAHRGVVDEA